MSRTERSASEPRKAYLVTFRIVNKMETVVYADSPADARRRFDAGEGNTENTYMDYRMPGVKVRRLEDEDR